MIAALLVLALAPQERLLDRECGGAVLEGLRSLRASQKADGSCGASHPVGVTSLAILAFLGADFTPASKDLFGGKTAFGEVVSNALKFLITRQDKEGCLVDRNETKYMYDHIVATLALSEAHGRTRAEGLKAPLEKAVAFLVAAQNPGKGWRYSPKCGDNDTSVTSWALLALRSAEISGIAVPKQAFEDGQAWIRSLTDEKGRPGYTHKGQGKIYLGTPRFDDHETRVALALLTCPGAPGLDLVKRDVPDAGKKQVDFLYWFLAGAALRRAADPAWAEWKKSLLQILRRLQDKDGSWPAADAHSTDDAGPIYATAINTLTLETCAGYPGVFLLRAK